MRRGALCSLTARRGERSHSAPVVNQPTLPRALASSAVSSGPNFTNTIRYIPLDNSKPLGRSDPGKRSFVDEASSPKPLKPSTSTSTPEAWTLGRVPSGFWSEKANQVAYLDWLGKELLFETLEDWYFVTKRDFRKNSGGGFLERFGNSPSAALSSIYSEHVFSKASFSPKSNPERYLAWLRRRWASAETLGRKDEVFWTKHESGLKSILGESPVAVKQRRGQSRLWDSMGDQRAILDSVGSKIGVQGQDLSPWYGISKERAVKLGCGSLLRHYRNSCYRMLRKVYPEHDWIPWRFKQLPRFGTERSEVIRGALDYVETEKKIGRPEDWYQIGHATLHELGVHSFVARAGGLYKLLKQYRPEFPWKEEKFLGVRIFGGKYLGAVLRDLFPDSEVASDFDLGDGIRFSYIIPQFKLAFDYQRVRDYELSLETGKVSVELIEDSEKKAVAERLGLTLVFVPFWWDLTPSSLIATLLEFPNRMPKLVARKDLEVLGSQSSPIPRETIVDLTAWSKRKRERAD